MTADEALVASGWAYHGICGTCNGKLETWKHPDRAQEEIKKSKRLGYFYHYKGKYLVKADYLETLKNYIRTA